MRRQLTEAARECRSTTLTNAADQLEFIQRLAASIAGQSDRVLHVEGNGNRRHRRHYRRADAADRRPVGTAALHLIRLAHLATAEGALFCKRWSSTL